MPPETLRKKPYAPEEISRTLLPTVEELKLFEDLGIFNALEGTIEYLRLSHPDVLPVNPYYKASDAGQKIIAMGVRWDFKDEEKKTEIPTRSCNHLEVLACLDDGKITIGNGAETTVIRRKSWRKNPSEVIFQIKLAAVRPGRHTWTESGKKED
jgi:hypothetical protein